MSIKVDKHGNILDVESGETSLAQKFTESNLDSYFIDGDFDKIKDLWVEILVDKYNKVIEDTGLKKIYYIFLMRGNMDYYLFIANLNYELISKKNLRVNYDRSTKDSVYLNGFIDNKFGSIKIYKAKKRLELRLLPKFIIDNNFCYKFNPLKYPDKKI